MNIIGIDRHVYAPELNKIFIQTKSGIVSFSCPNCTTTKEARDLLFPKPFKGLHCRIDSYYNEKRFKSLDRKAVARGFVATRLQALRYSKQFQQTGGELLNGDTLPPNNLKLTFKYN